MICAVRLLVKFYLFGICCYERLFRVKKDGANGCTRMSGTNGQLRGR